MLQLSPEELKIMWAVVDEIAKWLIIFVLTLLLNRLRKSVAQLVASLKELIALPDGLATHEKNDQHQFAAVNQRLDVIDRRIAGHPEAMRGIYDKLAQIWDRLTERPHPSAGD